MTFKLSELLNPVSSPIPHKRSPPPAPATRTGQPPAPIVADASGAAASTSASASASVSASVLPVLEPTASSPVYASTFEQQHTGTAHNQSRHGSLATPVEPLGRGEHPGQNQPFSPTLDHYHIASKSPEQQRRESLIPRSSPPPKLAPIQDLAAASSQDRPAAAAAATAASASPPSHAHAHDFSHILSPSPGAHENNHTMSANNPQDEAKDSAHCVSETKQPSASGTPALDAPSTQHAGDPTQSLIGNLKQEPVDTPPHGASLALAPSEQGAAEASSSLDTETLKPAADIKPEHGARGASREATTPTTESAKSGPPTKKRAAPNSAAPKKKGTATAKKPPSKKRKVEPEGANGISPAGPGRRSETPKIRLGSLNTNLKTTKRGSQANTPIAGSSPTVHSPADGSDDEDTDDGDSDDDGQLFCICRKPDDHKFMIGCDGGCDDWYHGACVNMLKEDSQLIDKYICPICEKAGKGVTTWKPMCRREGCRRPAKVGKPASKFCSEECGIKFFEEKIGKSTASNKTKASKRGPGAPKRKDNTTTDNDVDMMDDEDEDYEPPPRGGAIRARDLKTLATASENADSFRRLGSGVLSPPGTASPTKASFADDSGSLANGNSGPNGTYSFTPAESARLAEMGKEKDVLFARRTLLRDREKFIGLVRDQANKHAEREGLKVKEVCGFDSRLAWSEREFQAWRTTKKGQLALETGSFQPTEEASAGEEGQTATSSSGTVTADPGNSTDAGAMQVDGSQPDDPADAKLHKPLICTKKRCERHKQWHKLLIFDCRNDEVLVIEAVGKLQAEEREIRERALLRWRTERVEEKGGMSGMRREGWVEMVEG